MTAEAFKGVLRDDLRDAMRARDMLRVSALRMLIAAIDNAEAVPLTQPADGAPNTRAVSGHIAVTGAGPSEVQRRILAASDIAAILQAESDALAAAGSEMRALGQEARADESAAKAAIARSYIERATAL